MPAPAGGPGPPGRPWRRLHGLLILCRTASVHHAPHFRLISAPTGPVVEFGAAGTRRALRDADRVRVRAKPPYRRGRDLSSRSSAGTAEAHNIRSLPGRTM